MKSFCKYLSLSIINASYLQRKNISFTICNATKINIVHRSTDEEYFSDLNSPLDKLCNPLSDSPLFHTNPTKRIPIVLKRNIVFLQIPLAKIRKCLRRPNDPKVFPRRKAEFLHPRYTKRRTRLRASLSKTNANYTLTKLRVQFVSRPGGVASNFGRNGSSST